MEQKNPVGLVVGLVIGLMLGLTVGAVWTNREARRGWNLLPVIVASQDLPAGTALTFDHLNQRSIPEQFVTDSIVKPDVASDIINRTLRVPVKQGDPILWTHFSTRPAKPAPEGQAVGSDSAR